MRLVAVPKSWLQLGHRMTHDIRDSTGRILMGRGQFLQNPKQLDVLRSRTVYFDFTESGEYRTQILETFADIERRDGALKEVIDVKPENTLQIEKIKDAEIPRLWTELEGKLALLLRSPDTVQNFPSRVAECCQWMRTLLTKDMDLGLYLLIQQAQTLHSGYSASHSLLCGVLCDLVGRAMQLQLHERDSLVHAAFTMNVAMAALQDHLAMQKEGLSPGQKEAIHAHAARGRLMLAQAGVTDELWLDTVAAHHEPITTPPAGLPITTDQLLPRILGMLDRYTAGISPRRTRKGRSVLDSTKGTMVRPDGTHDDIGRALVKSAGLCPPGSYVKLMTGETAVVLRRGARANQPMVAVVVNRKGDAMAEPRVCDTSTEGFQVQGVPPASAVRVRLREDQLGSLFNRAKREGSTSSASLAPKPRAAMTAQEAMMSTTVLP